MTVGLLAPSGFAYFAGLQGIWRAGRMAVPLQPSHPVEELEYILEDSQVRQIFTEASCRELALRLVARYTHLEIVYIEPFAEIRPPASPVFEEPDPEAGALMIYTSGTTGRPKGVVTTYKALNAQVHGLCEAWAWSPHDRTLNVLPLHHVHGVVVLSTCALMAGAELELTDKFSPELVWDRLRHRRLSVFMAVPTVYARLVEYWQQQPVEVQSELSAGAQCLRLAVSGSAALPVPLFESWRRIAGQPLLERYGMTEMGIALSNPLHGDRKAGSVGRPLAGVEVRLVDDKGAILEGAGQPGELQVRGQCVFKTYWRRPQTQAENFTEEGWFKTGDIAERDQDGDFRILGRQSQDIIKTGGYKVSALEIENRLLEHPEVHEAAVVGLSDEVWGERVAAWIVLKSGAEVDGEALSASLKGKLARYKVPTVWRFVPALPRNALGKVIKSQLKEALPSRP